MIICHRCGKENQDHYKFCLGCGAELTAPLPHHHHHQGGGGGEMGMMKTMMADVGQSPTPPGGTPIVEHRLGTAAGMAPGPHLSAGGLGVGASAGAAQGAGPGPGPRQGQGARMGGGIAGSPAPQPAPAPAYRTPGAGVPQRPNAWEQSAPAQSAPAPVVEAISGGHSAPVSGSRSCPSCGTLVPPEFRFCGGCGFKMPADAAPTAPQQPAPHFRARAIMTLIRPDGSEGGMHELMEGENLIGREHGELFENDGYLSPSHAALVITGNSAHIRDLNSLNGVFVKMTDEEELQPGQIIRIGQELLRFDLIEPPQPTADGTEVMGSPNPGYWGKITVIIGKDVDGSAYPLLGDSVTLGRERGEINFPDDGYVSGLHARISNHEGRVILADLGSSNGTFIKVPGERELAHDSFVLLGQQLFRISMQ